MWACSLANSTTTTFVLSWTICAASTLSGKDYTVHSALNNLLNNPDYHIPAATVVSNEREIYEDGKVTYMPVYLVMFMESQEPAEDDSEYLF